MKTKQLNQQLDQWMEQYQQGQHYIKQQMIEEGIRFVQSRIDRLKLEDQQELLAVGMIGFIQSLENYSITEQNPFHIFSKQYIDHQIQIFLETEKQYLDYKYNVGLEAESFLDLEETYIEKENREEIRCVVESLPVFDRTIIKLYFGFFNGFQAERRDIAHALQVSPHFITQKRTEILKMLARKLQGQIVSYDFKKPLTSVYEILNFYQEEQIEQLLLNLKYEEQVQNHFIFSNPFQHTFAQRQLDSFLDMRFKKLLDLPILDDIIQLFNTNIKELFIIYLWLGIETEHFSVELISYGVHMKREDIISIIRSLLLRYQNLLYQFPNILIQKIEDEKSKLTNPKKMIK